MTKITLSHFDQEFLETIKYYKKIHLNHDEGIYYTTLYGGVKAGVIGFKVKENGRYFLKIGMHQDFRGKGIFRKALGLLARKHGIKTLYSTVAIANKRSAIAHEKLGFKRIDRAEENELKKKGLLLKRNMRYLKVF